MNEVRFNRVIQGGSSVARKVYEAVPIADAWNPSVIHQELRRIGYTMDLHAIKGCLAALAAEGVAIEHPARLYQRTPVKPRPIKEIKAEEPMATVAAAPAKVGVRPLAKLANIASRAKNIAAMLNELASDIELAALDIDEQDGQNNAQVNKLKQLKELLKELS